MSVTGSNEVIISNSNENNPYAGMSPTEIIRVISKKISKTHAKIMNNRKQDKVYYTDNVITVNFKREK